VLLVVNRDRRLIAGTFNADYPHKLLAKPPLPAKNRLFPANRLRRCGAFAFFKEPPPFALYRRLCFFKEPPPFALYRRLCLF
jgi:hypothetical protein